MADYVGVDVANRTCATPDCSTAAAGRGKYCAEHSPRLARQLSLHDRILARIDRGDDHWRWTGYVSNGSCLLRYQDVNVNASRYLYELEHDPVLPGRVLERTCEVETCVLPDHFRPYVPIPAGVPHKPRDERFAAKVQQGEQGACWEWTGWLNNRGYGTFHASADKRHVYAHRYSYELHVGPIPEGAEVDHMCHRPACVNPAHLRLATRRLNLQNRSGPPTNNKSGHLGVYFETRSQRWVAQVKHRGRVVLSKRFHNKEDAAAAAIAGRNQYFEYNILDRL